MAASRRLIGRTMRYSASSSEIPRAGRSARSCGECLSAGRPRCSCSKKFRGQSARRQWASLRSPFDRGREKSTVDRGFRIARILERWGEREERHVHQHRLRKRVRFDVFMFSRETPKVFSASRVKCKHVVHDIRESELFAGFFRRGILEERSWSQQHLACSSTFFCLWFLGLIGRDNVRPPRYIYRCFLALLAECSVQLGYGFA